MSDYLVKSIDKTKNLRLLTITAKGVVSEAQKRHDLWSASAAVLGRTLVGSLLLAGAELNGEKLFKLENGNYRYHVCLQVNKQYLADQLTKAFEGEAKLKAAFDKAQFKKTYDEQMKAFLESQK